MVDQELPGLTSSKNGLGFHSLLLLLRRQDGCWVRTWVRSW